tara:strand:+ start:2749 stop:4041 length:1293 start_codon:yes stop_codon:yes gene_type:complete
LNVAVIGTGYVGLVSGACLSEIGHKVVCVDIDESKIEKLNKGISPIYEPGIEEVIEKNAKAGRLSFTTDFDSAVKASDVIFIAVGTPPKENGEADLSFVENVARSIAEAAETPKVVVEKSTVPVETGERVNKVLHDYNPHNVKFEVVSNPEFLREGSAVEDFMKPDRIVIGTDSEHAKKVMEELYAPFKSNIVFTDIRSAEIIKHASNSFLATKISFINAVANLCEKTGANIEHVSKGMGLDNRIGKSFLNAGIGYGGFCFPKDVDAFVSIAEKNGYDFGILKEVQKVNKQQRKNFVKKIEEKLWILKDKRVAVLGLAFKPNTDDMRFAPSIDIINALLAENAVVAATDPEAEENAKRIFGDKIELNDDAYEAVKGADALLLLTEWKQFGELDFAKVKELMRGKLVFDGRNFLDEANLKELGFEYVGVGK